MHKAQPMKASLSNVEIENLKLGCAGNCSTSGVQILLAKQYISAVTNYKVNYLISVSHI